MQQALQSIDVTTRKLGLREYQLRTPAGFLEKPYKHQLTLVLKKFEVWNPGGGI